MSIGCNFWGVAADVGLLVLLLEGGFDLGDDVVDVAVGDVGAGREAEADAEERFADAVGVGGGVFIHWLAMHWFPEGTRLDAGLVELAAMHASGKRPKIVMGPNMRAMGIESFEQIEEMARRGEDFPPMPKVGRNDPCPCGSGKKYKHCCGR